MGTAGCKTWTDSKFALDSTPGLQKKKKRPSFLSKTFESEEDHFFDDTDTVNANWTCGPHSVTQGRSVHVTRRKEGQVCAACVGGRPQIHREDQKGTEMDLGLLGEAQS